MKKIVAAIVIAIMVSVLALSGQTPPPAASTPTSTQPNKKITPPVKKNPLADKSKESKNPIVDFEADVISKRDKADSTIYLVGNVSFHHNGAIIQCDSAARYSDQRMDCYGNVIINKDSAYIYGDRAAYDGTTATAEVFSPLVKMVRGDVTLLTYNLKFNTKTSTATFVSGGYMTQKQNVMESTDGEYNADKNIIKFLRNVAMRTEQYRVKTDSLSYNLDTETAQFLARPTVWDKDSSILEADGGFYYGKKEAYEFVGNSYILTKDQEMWADTMNYYTPMRQATMTSNVQVLDTTQRSIALSQWAFYDDSVGTALLTRRASLRGYAEDKKDTTYMRADSIYLFTFLAGKAPKRKDAQPETDSVAYEEQDVVDSLGEIATADSMALMPDSLRQRAADSLAMLPDSLRQMAADSLTMPKQDSVAQKTDTSTVKLPTVVKQPTRDSVELPKQDSLMRKTDTVTTGKKIRKRATLQPNERKKSRAARRNSAAGVAPSKDSLVVSNTLPPIIDSIKSKHPPVIEKGGDTLLNDSLGGRRDSLLTDSLGRDSVALDSVVKDSLGAKKKTTAPEKDRVVKAYHSVRTWAKDYQAVCDSTIAFSADSLAILYGRPVLWSSNSQITSDRIDVYSRNEELDWADFVGSPFVIEKIKPKHPEEADSMRYSQASGNELQAYFVDNDIDSAVMSGNVRNYYYMVSEEGYTQAFATMDCARLLIRFHEREPSTVNWMGSPSGVAYPLNKIPLDNTQRLPGFAWYDSLRPRSAQEISPEILKQSRRAEVSQLVPPAFDLETQIKKYREELLNNKTWKDRTEITTLTPEYFQQQNMLL